jgi:hypothetical protein
MYRIYYIYLYRIYYRIDISTNNLFYCIIFNITLRILNLIISNGIILKQIN